MTNLDFLTPSTESGELGQTKLLISMVVGLETTFDGGNEERRSGKEEEELERRQKKKLSVRETGMKPSVSPSLISRGAKWQICNSCLF